MFFIYLNLFLRKIFKTIAIINWLIHEVRHKSFKLFCSGLRYLGWMFPQSCNSLPNDTFFLCILLLIGKALSNLYTYKPPLTSNHALVLSGYLLAKALLGSQLFSSSNPKCAWTSQSLKLVRISSGQGLIASVQPKNLGCSFQFVIFLFLHHQLQLKQTYFDVLIERITFYLFLW